MLGFTWPLRPRDDQPDPVAVDRIAGGCAPARTTIAERRAAIALLTGYGLTGSQIAGRLGVTRRTVERYRQRHRQLAGAA